MIDEMRSDYYYLWLKLRKWIIFAMWTFGLMNKYQIHNLLVGWRSDYRQWRYDRQEIYGYNRGVK